MRSGLSLSAIKTRQEQHDPETELVRVSVVDRHNATGTVRRFLTVQCRAEANLLAGLTEQQVHAMARFHWCYQTRTREAGGYKAQAFERIERGSGNDNESRMLTEIELEAEYRAWIAACEKAHVDTGPCRMIAGHGMSVTAAAKQLRMRRTRCRQAFADGLDAFIHARRAIYEKKSDLEKITR